MNERAALWWAERSGREQWLLRLLAVLAALVLGWLLIIRPLVGGLERAAARHGAALSGYAQARSSADALTALKAKPPPPLTGPVSEAVKTMAAEAGFELSRADAVGGDGVIISIVSAKTPAMMDWIASLERRGIYAEQASIRPNSDATITIDAKLRARSR